MNKKKRSFSKHPFVLEHQDEACGSRMRPVAANHSGFVLVPVAFTLALLGALAYAMTRESSLNLTMTKIDIQKSHIDSAIASAKAMATWHAMYSSCQVPPLINGVGMGGLSYTAESSGTPPNLNVAVTVQDETNNTVAEVSHDLIMYDYANPRELAIAPSKDAHFHEDNISHSHGDTKELRVRRESGKASRTSMQFDFDDIPEDVHLQSAEFRIYMYQEPDAAMLMSIKRLVQEWSEGVVSWSRRTTLGFWANGGGATSTSTAATVQLVGSGWYNVDLTDLTQGWLSGEYENFGFLLREEGSGSKREALFHSIEADDSFFFPKLTVAYACQCGSPCDVGVLVQDLYLATKDQEELNALSFEPEDIVRLSADGSNTNLFFDASTLNSTEKVAAVHVLGNERVLVAFEGSGEVFGQSYVEGDILELDLPARLARVAFDGSDYGIDEEISALSLTPSNEFLFSFKSNTTVSGVSVKDSDVLRFDPASAQAELFWDADEHRIQGKLVGLNRLPHGPLVMAFDAPDELRGVPFTPAQLIEFNADLNTAQLHFDGSVFADDDVGIQAVHVGDGIGRAYKAMAHWPFNEGTGSTAQDIRGGHTAALTTTDGWQQGGSGGAIRFTNSSSPIVVDDQRLLRFGDELTMMAWVYLEQAPTGDFTILSKSKLGEKTSYRFGLEDGRLYAHLDGDAGGVVQATNPVLEPDRWYHVAATFDGATGIARLYLDGSEVHRQSNVASFSGKNEDLEIGRGFIGLLDEVKLYNRAISLAEIGAAAALEMLPPGTSSAPGDTPQNDGPSPDPIYCNRSYADFFDSSDYANNNGRHEWEGPWQEWGQVDGPNFGVIQIRATATDRVLSFRGNNGSGETAAISRKADLSGADAAELSLEFARLSLEDGADRVSMYISKTGADGSWVLLDSFFGPAHDGQPIARTYDISEWASADTTVAFAAAAALGWQDQITVDNFLIRCND